MAIKIGRRGVVVVFIGVAIALMAVASELWLGPQFNEPTPSTALIATSRPPTPAASSGPIALSNLLELRLGGDGGIFALATNAVAVSRDVGRTWNTSPLPGGWVAVGGAMLGSGRILIVTTMGPSEPDVATDFSVGLSDDGGRSWSSRLLSKTLGATISADATTTGRVAILFGVERHGVDTASLVTSSDSGTTLTGPFKVTGPALVGPIALGSQIWATLAGRNNDLPLEALAPAVSDDGGRVWRLLELPPPPRPAPIATIADPVIIGPSAWESAVSYGTAPTGIVQIIRGDDRGVTAVGNLPELIAEPQMISITATDVYVASGTEIEHSQDAGKTWSSRGIGLSGSIAGVSFAAPGVGWVEMSASDGGFNVYTTEDQGVTWRLALRHT